MLKRLRERLSGFFTSPPVLRLLSAFMRRFFPIARFGKDVFVFRHPDVLEVLTSPDLSVHTNYAAKMEATTGAFFLGMDAGARYEREASFARAALRREDTERIRRVAARSAEARVNDGLARGRMDLVQDLSRPVALDVIQDFFGVAGPDRASMARWMRTIFWELFLNFGDEPSVTQRALVSSRELEPYLNALIAERKVARGDGLDTFLDRLLALQAGEFSDMDDASVRRNLGGVIVGAADTQSKAIVLAVEELLGRPGALEAAAGVAARGDRAGVLSHAFEALRFNPHNPLIVRHALRSTVLARGQKRERTVSAGERVFAMTLSASFDAAVATDARDFRPGRPLDAHLHFGYGLHRCFGEHVVRTVVPATLTPLLARARIHPRDAIAYEGPFPDRFDVDISPR